MCENAHKLSFLWCLQITSKYLCVFDGDNWSVVESTYEQKHNERNEEQMIKYRKSFNGTKQPIKENN